MKSKVRRGNEMGKRVGKSIGKEKQGKWKERRRDGRTGDKTE